MRISQLPLRVGGTKAVALQRRPRSPSPQPNPTVFSIAHLRLGDLPIQQGQQGEAIVPDFNPLAGENDELVELLPVKFPWRRRARGVFQVLAATLSDTNGQNRERVSHRHGAAMNTPRHSDARRADAAAPTHKPTSRVKMGTRRRER